MVLPGPSGEQPASLTLLTVPATAGLRAGKFPADEPLDSGQAEHTRRRADAMVGSALVICSPARCARQTAQALGLAPIIQDEANEMAYGRWAGLSLKDVAAAEPDALSSWLTDPGMKAHGGESVSAFVERVGHWAEQYPWPPGRTLVITHASVVKAFVLRALGAPVEAYWRLDIAPLSGTTLTRHKGQWRLTACGVP